MDHVFNLMGPEKTVEIFGVKLLGVNAPNLMKIVVSLGVVLALVFLSHFARKLFSALFPENRYLRFRFWTMQLLRMISVVFGTIALVSIWFDDPGRLATAAGLLTAGLAFALQKVITAVAGIL